MSATYPAAGLVAGRNKIAVATGRDQIQVYDVKADSEPRGFAATQWRATRR